MRATAITNETFEAARLGDPDAIVCLLARTQPDIRRFARASCRTAADAEDASQETLWLLFRHVGAIRLLATLHGWLFSVARRECMRLARRAGLVAMPSDEEAWEASLARRPEAELRLDLTAAFEALPPQYRQVAVMRDLEEMPIDEIAMRLGASRQAIKARLRRARLLLREYLTR